MSSFERLLVFFYVLLFGVVISCIVVTLNGENPPQTQEVCTRSHIKRIPVTGLDGATTLVPAERCDHYKIVKAD